MPTQSDQKPRKRGKATGSPATASPEADGSFYPLPSTSVVAGQPEPLPDVVADSTAKQPTETAGLGEAERVHLGEINKLNANVRRLKEEHADAAEAAKGARKRLEAAQEELSDYIARGPERHPLFDGPAPVAEPKPAPDAAGDDEVWRGKPLAEIGLTDAALGKLDEAGLRTVGDVADWTGAGKSLEDVPGVGEATAAAIDEALTAYWRSRSEAESPTEAVDEAA